jgi:hypothetical protein
VPVKTRRLENGSGIRYVWSFAAGILRTAVLYFLGVRRLDSESPQQKPLDGEALALIANLTSETRGSRIEAKENVFLGGGAQGYLLKYLNCPWAGVFYR